ncbi:MAG: hypothetical protein GVY12_18045 [Bacteroidetes bacterium]|jgi:hypothetical protein|nr:hypothetical protein [Bacteroidota bacterium]
MLRYLLRIPTWLIKGALWTLLLGVLLYFGLTRTQVGRDALLAEVERQFDQQFAGELRIGKLTGNLAQDLYATDVALIDPAGRQVLTVDSLVARPSWRALWGKELAVRSVYLYQPTLRAVEDSAGVWNIAAALSRRDATSADTTTDTGRPWAFTSSLLQIYDGTIETTSAVPRAEQRDPALLFDWRNDRVEALDLETTVERADGVGLLDIQALSAYLPTHELPLRSLTGQVVVEETLIALNALQLELGATELQGGASVSGARSEEALPDADVRVDVEPSRLQFTELQRLFPALPLREDVQLQGTIRGPLQELLVDSLTVAHGASRATLSGTVFGWPTKVDADVGLTNLYVEADDVAAVYPGGDVSRLRAVEPVEGRLTTTGVLEGGGGADWRLTSDHTINVITGAGALDGNVALSRTPEEGFAGSADVSFENVNPAAWADQPSLNGLLTGQLKGDAEGRTWASLQSSADLQLGTSQIGDVQLDATAIAVEVRDEVAYVSADLAQFPGRITDRAHNLGPANGHRLQAQGRLSWGTGEPSYTAEVSLQDFDMGHLLSQEDARSRLNLTVAVEGRGLTGNTLDATAAVAFAPSLVVHGTRLSEIPAFDTELAVAPVDAEKPQLALTGDLGQLQIDTDATWAAVQATATRWVASARERIAIERAKTQARRDISHSGSVSNADATAIPVIALEATLDLQRPDIIRALLPVELPRLDYLRGSIRLSAGADTLALTGTMQAQRFDEASIAVYAPRLEFQLATAEQPGQLFAPTASAQLTADSMQVTGQRVGHSRTGLQYDGQTATLTHQSERLRQDDPLKINLRLESLSDRQRLTLDTLRWATGPYVWKTGSDGATAEWYSDALVVPAVDLQSRHPVTNEQQHIAVEGVWSTLPEDTLRVQFDTVGLRPIADLLAGGRPIGGLASGNLALTNRQAPEVTGHVDVDALSYDDRLLGQLQVRSGYQTRATGVRVGVDLTPYPDGEAPQTIYGTSTPARIERNDIRVDGTVQLPTSGTDDRLATLSDLDLSLDIDALSAFFFDFLFPDVVSGVEGTFSGGGTVTGPFTDPTFDVDLTLTDGALSVPRFNLSYDVSGPVAVTREGIILEDVALQDPTAGEGQVSGLVNFNDYEFFSFDLEAQLEELRIMNVRDDRTLPFYGEIWASGQASLTGPVYEALLSASDAETSPQSEVFIPIVDAEDEVDSGFIVYADTTEEQPDPMPLRRRANILADRPETERAFLDGLNLDLNFNAPEGSTVNLVIDPLLGEVVRAVGGGRIQLQRQEGEWLTFGTFTVTSGDYLFTAGEVFVRRFTINEGTIVWDGDPIDASLNIQAAFRTRASRAGLPAGQADGPPIPLSVLLDITGRVSSPQIDLSLELDARDRSGLATEQLQALLNQPGLSTELATSVLITNSFLLTTETGDSGFLTGSAFNSLSQLVGSQLNRYINEVLPNVDITLGVQGDENVQDLDVTYGLALRLLDNRLLIRGQGVYSGGRELRDGAGGDLNQQGLEGEFVVEVRLSRSVSLEVFYRREGDLLDANQFTNTTGAGLSYQRQFTSFTALFRNGASTDEPAPPPDEADLPPPITSN